VAETVPVEPSPGYDDRDGSLLARTAFPNFHSTENSCGSLLAHNHAPYNARGIPLVGRRGGCEGRKASVANSPGTIDLTFPAMTSLPFDRNGSNVTKNSLARDS